MSASYRAEAREGRESRQGAAGECLGLAGPAGLDPATFGVTGRGIAVRELGIGLVPFSSEGENFDANLPP